MPTYVIGDIQGCYQEFRELLHRIHFNPQSDQLWLTGDIVNRGPQSREVLDFIFDHQKYVTLVLGNHDLHLLSIVFANQPLGEKDTLQAVLDDTHCEMWCRWLLKQPLAHHDKARSLLLVHAGIAPQWTLKQTLECSSEIETVLKSPGAEKFLSEMRGDDANLWSDDLSGPLRLRTITNYFTRVRFCDAQGKMDLKHKTALGSQPSYLFPWYGIPNQWPTDLKILFGHWAALEGKTGESRFICVDTGCVWGNALSALCLETGAWFQVPGHRQRRS